MKPIKPRHKNLFHLIDPSITLAMEKIRKKQFEYDVDQDLAEEIYFHMREIFPKSRSIPTFITHYVQRGHVRTNVEHVIKWMIERGHLTVNKRTKRGHTDFMDMGRRLPWFK